MKQTVMTLVLVLAVLFGLNADLRAESEAGSTYGHISYFEGNPTISRADGARETATVNLPLVPGDELATDARSKIEFQFDNGSVMRLGPDSRLKIATVLAESLTSRWKITTLELLEGKFYTLNQSYRTERFQVITPNAAIQLKHNSKTTIEAVNGETRLFVDSGKIQVMFGGELKNLKTESISDGGPGYLISKDHQMLEFQKRDVDFLAWNEHINNNFKELHYGVNKVPAKLYRYPKVLVKWAEKWSTLFGEWVYDEIFGYVWKPADERFAFSARPFYNAQHVRVNNELFLVPSQPWGWVPGHMGTWVWMDWGWTWVPGSAFTGGFDGPFPYGPENLVATYSSNFLQWLNYIYGGVDMYYVYRHHGFDRWREACESRGLTGYKEPSYKNLPKDIKTILTKMDKTPVAVLEKRIGKVTPEMLSYLHKPTDANPKNPVRLSEPRITAGGAGVSPVAGPAISANTAIQKRTISRDEKEAEAARLVKLYRNFNPDSRWAIRRGVTVAANPSTNEFVCPELNLSSRTITEIKRHELSRIHISGSGMGAGVKSPYVGPVDNSASTTDVRGNGGGIAGRVDKSGSGSSQKEKK